MGWWSSESEENDLIGDGPADIMMDCFQIIVQEFGGNGRVVLPMRQFVDALTLALERNPTELFGADVWQASCRVAVQLANRLIVASQEPNVDKRIVDRIFDAFKKCATEYVEMGPERKPRPNELLETVDFVLGYRLPNYASITDEVEIERLMLQCKNDD